MAVRSGGERRVEKGGPGCPTRPRPRGLLCAPSASRPPFLWRMAVGGAVDGPGSCFFFSQRPSTSGGSSRGPGVEGTESEDGEGEVPEAEGPPQTAGRGDVETWWRLGRMAPIPTGGGGGALQSSALVRLPGLEGWQTGHSRCPPMARHPDGRPGVLAPPSSTLEPCCPWCWSGGPSMTEGGWGWKSKITDLPAWVCGLTEFHVRCALSSGADLAERRGAEPGGPLWSLWGAGSRGSESTAPGLELVPGASGGTQVPMKGVDNGSWWSERGSRASGHRVRLQRGQGLCQRKNNLLSPDLTWTPWEELSQLTEPAFDL